MKKSFYYVLVALISCILVCCKDKSNEVVITGQLEGVEDGVAIKLMKLYGSELIDIQTDTIVNGAFKFAFMDSLNQPKSMLIMAEGEGFPPTWLELWVIPGANIGIAGKDKLIRSWEVNSAVAEQIELNKYSERIRQHEKIAQSIMQETFSCIDEMYKSPEKTEELEARVEELYAINDSISIIISETEINLMDENKTYSPVWMEKLERYATSLQYAKLSDTYVEKLKKMYEGMSNEFKNSEKGRTIHLNLYSSASVN